MGDVKRYTESCMEGGGVCPSRDGEFVTFLDYETVLAREAALREDLDDANKLCVLLSTAETNQHFERNDLQQRLTAAEQRNAELQKAIFSALDDSSENAETGEITIMRADYEALAILIGEPTESGASE